MHIKRLTHTLLISFLPFLLISTHGTNSNIYGDDLSVTTSDTSSNDSSKVNQSSSLFKKNVGYNAFNNSQSYDFDEHYTLLQKGVSSVGFRLAFGGGGTDADWIGSFIKIESRNKFNFGVGLNGNYFFKDNVSVGLRLGFNYRHNELHLNGKIFELAMDARDYDTRSASESYFATGFIRNYIPLGQLQRFYFINESNLYYSYTHSLARDTYDNGKSIMKIERHTNDIGIGLTLGLMYFLSKGFAFEFTISPLVAYFEYTKVLVDEVDPGSNNNWGFNFRFIPNMVNVGFTYYIGLDYKKYNEEMRKRNL